MRIRKIRKRDYSQIDRLLLQLHEVDLLGRPELFSKLDHYMSRESFECLLDNENIIPLLAEAGGQVIGCCFVSLFSRSAMAQIRTAYIDLLVVDRAHRRTGVGKALFRAVEQCAGKRGARRIDLTVWSHNPIARKAYESYGMTPQRWIYEKHL